MRDYAMFWGCTIPARFPFIEKATRLVLDDLGVRIHELDGHTCCPEGTLVKAVDPEAYHVVAARNLAIVGRSGLDLVTPCNGCYSTFKETQRHMSAAPAERADVDGQARDRGPGLARRACRSCTSPSGWPTWRARPPSPGAPCAAWPACASPCTTAATCCGRSRRSLGRPAAADQGRDAGPRARRARRRLPDQDAVLRRRARPRRPARDLARPWRAPSCSSCSEREVDALVVVCPSCFQQFDLNQAALQRADEDVDVPVLYLSELLALCLRPRRGRRDRAGHAPRLRGPVPRRRGTSAKPAATGRASRLRPAAAREVRRLRRLPGRLPGGARWTRSSGPTRSSAGSSTATSRASSPTARRGSASSASPAWSSATRASGWPRRSGCSRSTPPRETASRTRCARPTTCSPATACWASRASPRAASSACRRSPPPAARRSRACSPAARVPRRRRVRRRRALRRRPGGRFRGVGMTSEPLLERMTTRPRRPGPPGPARRAAGLPRRGAVQDPRRLRPHGHLRRVGRAHDRRGRDPRHGRRSATAATASAAASPATASTPTSPTTTLPHDVPRRAGAPRGREAVIKQALHHRRGRAHAHRRHVDGIVDPPLLWRYFLMPRPAQGRGHRPAPSTTIVVRTVMGINAGVDGAFVASSGKNMGAFKGVGYPEEIGRVLPPRGVRGPHVDSATTASRPTPPAGGAARTRSRCSTGRSSTTARSRATASTAATSSSSATAARSAPTPRSPPTSSTCCCAATGCRSSSPARRSPARSGARSTACRRRSAS